MAQFPAEGVRVSEEVSVVTHESKKNWEQAVTRVDDGLLARPILHRQHKIARDSGYSYGSRLNWSCSSPISPLHLLFTLNPSEGGVEADETLRDELN
ncbi:MAG: hypothetical protein A2156_06210 [Deltaproteobacteria bacterium RBG_16_48_10]|nr:MAG: hypothetical protein A2156_06210 [Deltaproteobacteria bacterium RBG_16_48_10]